MLNIRASLPDPLIVRIVVFQCEMNGTDIATARYVASSYFCFECDEPIKSTPLSGDPDSCPEHRKAEVYVMQKKLIAPLVFAPLFKRNQVGDVDYLELCYIERDSLHEFVLIARKDESPDSELVGIYGVDRDNLSYHKLEHSVECFQQVHVPKGLVNEVIEHWPDDDTKMTWLNPMEAQQRS